MYFGPWGTCQGIGRRGKIGRAASRYDAPDGLRNNNPGTGQDNPAEITGPAAINRR
jgi:hypothetical protein